MSLLARLSLRSRLLIALVSIGLLLFVLGGLSVIRIAQDIGGGVVAQTA
ncbi:MAG: hypothetical protein ACOY6N_10735 [Pseudomonadota bacterium]